MFNWFKNKDNIDNMEKNPQELQTSQPKSSSNDFLTIERAKQVDDNDLLLYLKKQLGIDSEGVIEVTGELSAEHNSNNDSYYYRIHNVKLKTGEQVEYPISNLDERDSIQKKGIYVPYIFNKALKKYVNDGARVLVKCELELSSTFERTKHNNPLLINVDPKSIRVLDKISEAETIKDNNGNILLEDSVVNYYAKLNKQKIQEATSKELETLEKERDEIKAKLLKLSGEHSSKEENMKDQEVKLEKLRTEIGMKQESKEHLKNEVEEIKIELDNLKDMQMKKIEKFRSFIKAKADSLLTLEFIDESQYNEILGIKHTDIEKSGQFLDFTEDFNADYTQAISQIQAYLFEKNIIYPKYVLEDYFSLIKTNDLIILAGDSGSGKTNLVKSFADAVGGVSKVIPVKPSWTSSEDLLGYYNPLQKTYLSTPFLEALIEASQNPEVPYFICLDEMNLARVEYYFADFLSVLEERDTDPEIFLYSDEESNHVLSEFNNVIQAIEGLKEKYNKNDITSFYDILKDSQINTELKEILGLSDKVSLISYHSTLRRMLGGILNIPSSIVFPRNVRIIGAINIDETTHYLSPKVLDRAHVIKFDNPLLSDWSAIENEVASSNIENPNYKIKFSIEQFGERKPYPKFSKDDEFCNKVVELTKDYFKPLGVEIGLRTIRQGLNYNESFLNFSSDEHIAFNNFILHKILPKFTFDGSTTVGNKDKLEIVDEFKTAIKHIINEDIEGLEGRSSIEELNEILQKSKENDSIINYWA
ncbi:MAG: AAA family ATPase [Bacteroidales bacterium]|nr:AAA family ATPase [Bacteroidales bacterium]